MTLVSPARRTVATIESGRQVELVVGDRRTVLHALWLRDRTTAPGQVDPSTNQRLFDPPSIAPDLRVVEAGLRDGVVDLAFSDGHRCSLDVERLAVAAGVIADPEEPPAAEAWLGSPRPFPDVAWSSLADAAGLADALGAFYRHGVIVVRGGPVEMGSVVTVAERFGRVSPTIFGAVFDVVSSPDPTDLAYTAVRLAAHTDQPYRRPVPGIQLLHCLANDAPGGDTTVVDGLAAAELLGQIDPDAHRALCELDVEFRYDIGSDVTVGRAPIIGLDRHGRFASIRYSPRLDFPLVADPVALEHLYRGRRWLANHFDDPAAMVSLRLDAGDTMVVDNHRVLHGRTAFDPDGGRRHLQGCYIDHDGPETAWRLAWRSLARGGER